MKNAAFVTCIFAFITASSAFTQNSGTVLDYSGKSPVEFFNSHPAELILLNYWATYCGPCKEEMQELMRLYSEEKAKGLLVIGASVDLAKDASLVEKTIADLRIGYPVLYGLDANFKDRRVTLLPTTFLIDSEGFIVDEIVGRRSYEFFKAKVKDRLRTIATKAQESTALSPGLAASPFYRLEAVRLADGETIELCLTPLAKYHLNGPGYPSLTLSVNAPPQDKKRTLSSRGDELKQFSVVGIAEGKSAIWRLKAGGHI